MYPTAYENGGELTRIVAETSEFQTWSLDAKNMPLKGDFSSCEYKYLNGIYVKDGVILSFDDLTFTLYPFSSNPGKSVFKSAKVSGNLMELYREAWSVTSSANTTRPTPAYTLRRVK